ncbi:MAG: hypothetical protein HRU12_11675 [Phaeodactylibacter sp.]|nr:hypothetical protein [Phaeodactylibacter sp.]
MNQIESQNKQILNYLIAGNSITQIDALRLFGCFRLSGRIWDLRREHDITTDMVKINGKRVARYTYRNQKSK